MVIRILMFLMMLVLAAGFVFFAANVIWLGTREFFKTYGPGKKAKAKNDSKESSMKGKQQ